MKKTLLTILLIAGFIVGGQMTASAQALPRAVDTDAWCAIIMQFAHAQPPENYLLLDNAGDGIPDPDQYALLCAILADGSSPFHSIAIDVWNHNFATAVQDILPAVPASDSGMYPFRAGIAMLMTTGSAGDIADCMIIMNILAAYGVNPADFNAAEYQSLSSVLPGGADPDMDGLTNKEEYDAIEGNPGPGPKRDQWIQDVQVAANVELSAVASGARYQYEVGNSVTLKVVAAHGTEPYFYQWLKNGAIIPGADSDTYTIPALSLSDAGDYSARVRDSAGGLADSNVVTLRVLPEGSLPVAGLVGLGVLAAACAVFGVRKALKK